MAKVTKPQISGKGATYVPLEAEKYGPIPLASRTTLPKVRIGRAIAHVSSYP
jgi:hypothetical protein